MLLATVGAAAVSGCFEAESEVDLGEGTQAITPNEGQGSDYQGSDYQGSDYQGSDYQGSDYQGSDYQGASLGGVMFASGTALYQDRALSVWRVVNTNPVRHEQLLPDRICTWDSTRTNLQGCTWFSSNQPGPLAGVTFETKFRKVIGRTVLTIPGKVRIRSVAGSVTRDSTLAMHPLAGHVTGGLPGGSNPAWTTVPCDNPKRCHLNNDLWTYDLQIVNTSNGAVFPFCPGGGRAYGVPGTYDYRGEFTPSTTRFTFACLGGTIAKCTKWGYRSWGRAMKSNDVYTDLIDYHRSCVRAAAADYCASGFSFTKNGTLVDIYDGDPGLVPPTRLDPSDPDKTAYVWESSFDRHGAVSVNDMRFAEDVAVGDVDDHCPGVFNFQDPQQGGDDVAGRWDRKSGWDGLAPQVKIDSTTWCEHSERTAGKWLSRKCSYCTELVGAQAAFAYCTDPSSPKGWDAGCVARANAQCTTRPHGECTSTNPAPLPRFMSACTIKVCSTNPSCCSTAWNATCVSKASQVCPAYKSNGTTFGFCGGAAVPPSPSL